MANKNPFILFETYKIPRRVSQAYYVLLNDRECLQNLLGMLDDTIWSLNAKDTEIHFSAPPLSDEPVIPFLQERHREAVDFAETMLFGRIVDSLNIYLIDICAMMELSAANLISKGGLYRFCEINIKSDDPIAKRLEALSKSSFPRLIGELKKRNIAITTSETLDTIQQIRITRNHFVHRRGIAGALISQFSSPPAHFTIDEDLVQPLRANVNVYIAAMEHVLSFCADIDVQAAALSHLPTRRITLVKPNMRPGKRLRTRLAKSRKRARNSSASSKPKSYNR